MKDTAYRKTEKILYSYPTLKLAIRNKDNEYKDKGIVAVARIEEALRHIEKEIYYDVIPLRYFNNETIESIANKLNISPPTVSRARVNLINKIKIFLFTNEAVDELFITRK